MKELVRILKTLSDGSRLRVLNLIIERECCVCEVMQVMDMSQSKASRTLTALYNAGILKQRKNGRWTLYSLDREGMAEHMNDIVAAVAQALAGNTVAVEDRERLKKAQRIGPPCATTPCETHLATSDSQV